jgi:7-cyano-7-deazaguanine synthase in queuosine biosynthesis
MLFEEINFDAVSFYEAFTPIKKEIEVPSNLVPFARAMSDHHRLDLSISESTPISSEERFETDPQKCIILFSSGIDSTWSLTYALDKGLTPYPVFIDGLNPATNSRERKSSLEICDRLSLGLNVCKHAPSLKKLHRDKANLIETPESLAKLQYALMLCKDLIRKESVGSVLVTVDQDNVIFHNPNSMSDENDEELDWFSDTEQSMTSFLPFLSDYVGGHVEGLYPSHPKSEKIRALQERDLLELTCSCVLNPMFFAGHRKKPYAPKQENMCGVCWKCKENLKFLKQLEGN